MSERILIAVGTSTFAGQNHFSGILRRLGDAADAYLKIVRSKDAITPHLIRDAIKSGVDGFIVSIPLAPNEKSKALAALAATDVPTVLISIHSDLFSRRTKNLAFVSTDNTEVGALAVEQFMRGAKRSCFAFVHARGMPRWSQERCASFTSALKAHGLDAVELQRPEDLVSLPRPLAIFAANDDVAHAIITQCRIHGLSVPGEVAVLGVDNDPTICKNVHPTISTIELDFAGEGMLAADLLLRLMARNSDRPVVETVRAKQIVLRESLASGDGRTALCERALAYVRAHALGPITVDDVARQLKASRRLLDLRMREIMGTTVGETIIELRLAEAKRLLATTDLPLDKIALACGYANTGSLRNLFRKRYGISPRAFREGKNPQSIT